MECLDKYKPRDNDYPAKFIKYSKQIIEYRIIDNNRLLDNYPDEYFNKLKDQDYLNQLFGLPNKQQNYLVKEKELNESSDFIIDLYDSINKLPRFSQIVIIGLLEYKDQRQIAQELNISATAINTLLKHQIYPTLKRYLKDYWI